MMRKLILRNRQSPGDIVMLTAAVRDLDLAYPGQFLTDVRTPCPQIWEHNPFLTRLDEHDPEVETIDCRYPLIHKSNQLPCHFVQGFIEFLNDALGLSIRVRALKGEVYLSVREKSWMSQVQEVTGKPSD